MNRFDALLKPENPGINVDFLFPSVSTRIRQKALTQINDLSDTSTV
jgi:hypothetical protein